MPNQQILDLLRYSSGLERVEIESMFTDAGWPVSRVRRALRRLIKSGEAVELKLFHAQSPEARTSDPRPDYIPAPPA